MADKKDTEHDQKKKITFLHLLDHIMNKVKEIITSCCSLKLIHQGHFHCFDLIFFCLIQRQLMLLYVWLKHTVYFSVTSVVSLTLRLLPVYVSWMNTLLDCSINAFGIEVAMTFAYSLSSKLSSRKFWLISFATSWLYSVFFVCSSKKDWLKKVPLTIPKEIVPNKETVQISNKTPNLIRDVFSSYIDSLLLWICIWS